MNLKAAVLSAGTGLWSGTFFQRLAAADKKQPPAESAPIGRRELVKGLDGMSRVADPGQNPFTGGHTAAAVMSSAFFCREQKIDADTQKEILALVEARLLKSPIYAPRTEKKADPELVEGLVKDLDAGIDSLRRSGHNIIFANISLKTLREVPEVPEAATPARGRSGEDAAELRDEVPFPDAGGTRVARHSPCHPPTIRAFGTVRRCKVRTCFRSSRRDCAKPCWNTWRLSRLSATA